MSSLISTNPITDEVVWQGPRATPAEVDAAVRRSHDAFETWSRTSSEDRQSIAENFAKLAAAAESKLARQISDEMGKPRWESIAEAKLIPAKVAATVDAWKQRCQDSTMDLSGGTGHAVYLPIRVLGVLGPFNLPAHLPNGHLVPALLLGNTVVFKPSEFTPGTGQMLVDLWHEAGLPDGVLQIVHGERDVGQAIVESRVNGILFTGSHRAGTAIHQTLGGRPDVLLALEMGGNNPLVVHQVEQLAVAAYHTAVSAFITSGQRCTCARELIIVDGDEATDLLDRLVETTKGIRIGPPGDDPEPFMGSVIHAGAAGQVIAAQQQLLDAGAKPILLSRLHADCPAIVTPGILDVTDMDAVPDEEVFGPLLKVRKVASFEDAIRHAGSSRYGLASALFSDDLECFRLYQQRLRFGVLNWNQATVGASGRLPFGGLRDSGNHRPSGFHAVDFCATATAQLRMQKLVLPANGYPGLSSQ